MMLITCRYCGKTFNGKTELKEQIEHESSCPVGEKQRFRELEERISKIEKRNKLNNVKY